MTMPSRGMPPPIDDELLSAYLDGQVSADERAAVEAAMAADPDVRARLADFRATVALLRALPQPAPRRTFILTPEQAAAIRPARVPWLTRLFPAVAAVGAVAAVLCLALIAGDLATGGFATKQRRTSPARPAVEAVSDAAATRVTTGAAAATTASGPAATTAPLPAAAANAPAPAVTIAAARSAGSLPQATAQLPAATTAAAILPTATLLPAPTAAAGSAAVNSAASQAGAATIAPTAVAIAQPPPPVTGASPSGGAVVTKETHRAPVALVRAGEVALALLAVAGITLAALGRRRKAHRASP